MLHIKKFRKGFNKVYLYLSLLLLVVMTISLFLQVFTRYILKSSLVGTEELARYCFIWLSMLGSSLCVSNNGHSFVSILNDSLSAEGKKKHNMVIDGTIIIFSIILIYAGVQMVMLTMGQKSPTLGIPTPVLYLSAVAGGFGMALNAGLNILFRRNWDEEGDK